MAPTDADRAPRQARVAGRNANARGVTSARPARDRRPDLERDRLEQHAEALGQRDGAGRGGQLAVLGALPQHPADRIDRADVLEVELHGDARQQRQRRGGDERAVGRQVADHRGEPLADRGGVGLDAPEHRREVGWRCIGPWPIDSTIRRRIDHEAGSAAKLRHTMPIVLAFPQARCDRARKVRAPAPLRRRVAYPATECPGWWRARGWRRR